MPAESLPHTLVMLVVSMAQPWAIMDTIKEWAEVLSTHVDRLKVSPETRREYEEKCKYIFVHVLQSVIYTCIPWKIVFIIIYCS